ncbi:helix-turn-helix domain-containing protein [Microbispora bryophytorum]|uniref:helix-turn-helix transcriptional regulator n=1 Tax=Microbispora bryophytorum TaxID=1460882 RepID=UPI0033EF3162
MSATHPLVVKLRQRRRQLGLTQTELEKRLGVQQDRMSEWERGHSYPVLPNLARYASGLGLRVAVVDPQTGHTLSSDPGVMVSAITAHRLKLGLSRGAVARRLGASAERVRAIETCTGPIRLLTVEEYAQALGLDLVLVFDRPRCCRCDPFWCRTDESGEHCATRSCGRCLHGCPAPDGECCEAAEPARAGS